MGKEKQNFKAVLIILSFLIVTVLSGLNILTSDTGSIPLLSLESFYVYIIAIIVAIYNVFNKKNPTIPTCIALFTYLWTYFLVHQLINYVTDIEITIEPTFYIYLSSSVFLFISLFVDNRKKAINNSNLNSYVQNATISNNSNVDANNFNFTKFVMGFKEIPYNTTVLLVNNTPSHTIDLIYSVGENTQTIQIPISSIKNISNTRKLRTSTAASKIEENETKSMLLSAVMFGGNSFLQLAGNSGFNSLFDSLSNNYDKVNVNVEYEIVIEYMTNNEIHKIVTISGTDPKTFISQILN